MNYFHFLLFFFKKKIGINNYSHALKHYSITKHSLVIELMNFECWCYNCDNYIPIIDDSIIFKGNVF